jgi:hypothetical protein
MFPVSAQEARWKAGAVQFDSSMEPLVRLLEELPRDRVLEEFAGQIRKGTSYRQILTALHLAGIRNVPPRPDVGWKFHCVLVLHSAHLASLRARDEERWLPVFFALDFFKRQQAYDERESDWSMGPANETAVTRIRRPHAEFGQAMDRWQEDTADAAVAAVARNMEPKEVFELFAYYGMRDFRNIGHKPIYMANCWRLLQFVGWQHAEPMLRSLVYALLNHHGEPNPSESKLATDEPWRANQERVEQIGPGWAAGEVSENATADLLATLRNGTWREAAEHVASLLQSEVSPQSVQDALFAGAAEQLMRQPGIVSLHGMTATNALAYAYRNSRNERTRKLILLQNAAFLVQFRETLTGDGPFGGSWGEDRIDQLLPDSVEPQGPSLEAVFDLVGRDSKAASRQALAYLQSHAGNSGAFLQVAGRLSMLKCQNGHDYKFSSAVLEDYDHISPQWRERYLAASVHYLRGLKDVDHPLVQPTTELLKA